MLPDYNTAVFNSRRAPAMARRGMVATAQPLASAAALGILLAGGNAVDAAVAAAAVLGVTEPFQTGLGGDCFALVHDARSGVVRALNASGPAPGAARLADYVAAEFTAVPRQGPLSWTVPGCVDGWCSMLAEHGTMSLAEVLQPAVYYARHGFPVAPGDAVYWEQQQSMLRADPGTAASLLISGRLPRAGDLLVQPALARTLEEVAEGGRKAFYEGPIGERLVAYSERAGGLLSRADLQAYRAEWTDPIAIDYRGHRVLQCPPNGQGIAALLALRMLEPTGVARQTRDSSACLHGLIEATKFGMTRSAALVADPRFAPTDVKAVLAEPPPGIPERATGGGSPPPPSDTVYVAVVDARGNAVSFINSVYGDFGSGMLAPELGFVLQNRGCGFSLDPAHPNCLAPGKRPYHTIIPAMMLEDGRPSLVFGVVGGFMQPQGHVQFLASLIDHGIDLQSAIDMPRFQWLRGNEVLVEDGFPPEAYAGLAARGHLVQRRAGHRGFGGAQAIAIAANGVLIGGSDPRQDGCAIGF